MSLQLSIAVTQLISRRRPTLVSLTGIALGVAFFLAVSSLMRGSERDFIKRLIDNSQQQNHNRLRALACLASRSLDARRHLFRDIRHVITP